MKINKMLGCGRSEVRVAEGENWLTDELITLK